MTGGRPFLISLLLRVDPSLNVFFLLVLLRGTRLHASPLIVLLFFVLLNAINILLVAIVEKRRVLVLFPWRLICGFGLLLLFLLLFEFFKHILVVQDCVCKFVLENVVVEELRDSGFDAGHL